MEQFSSQQYQILIERLLQESSSQGLFGNLDRVSALSILLGSPEKCYPTIHIAGSNGKGSVATKIAAALQQGGYKTALYTSPHLVSVQERMQINGNEISKKVLFTLLKQLYRNVEKQGITPTFFELVTCVAFSWFCLEQVDVAVIETGLGGEWDATNIITPLVSVITSISLEHTERLGNTEDAIAQAKAGIIKPGVPVVLGPKAVRNPIIQKAQKCGSAVYSIPQVVGWYDVENSCIAQETLNLLRFHFPHIPQNLQESLAKRPFCRFSWKYGALFDVAHNLDGFMRLFEGLALHFPGKKVRMILGLSRDKDIESCLRFIVTKISFLHLVQLPCLRAVGVEELGRIVRFVSNIDYISEKSIEKAVCLAKKQADFLGEILVVGGSFYLMQEALLALFKLDVLSKK